jgi:hypothetical protein
MKLIPVLVAIAASAFLVACGGASEDAKIIPLAQPAEATSTDIGDYVVHYSAQSTDQLTAEVAKAYGIVRSKQRAMLNVSVVQKSDDQSVMASVSVETRNLTGQLKQVSMRMIQEQNAIYYIGELPVANAETLIFDISVKPDAAKMTSQLRFKRQFFSN